MFAADDLHNIRVKTHMADLRMRGIDLIHAEVNVRNPTGTGEARSRCVDYHYRFETAGQQ